VHAFGRSAVDVVAHAGDAGVELARTADLLLRIARSSSFHCAIQPTVRATAKMAVNIDGREAHRLER
jgi:hypothetical protein